MRRTVLDLSQRLLVLMKYRSIFRQSTEGFSRSMICLRTSAGTLPQLLLRLASSAAFFMASLRASLAISFVVLSMSPLFSLQPLWSSKESGEPPPSPLGSPLLNCSSSFSISKYCSAARPLGYLAKGPNPGIQAIFGIFGRWELIARSVAIFHIFVIPSAGRRPVTCSLTTCQNSCISTAARSGCVSPRKNLGL